MHDKSPPRVKRSASSADVPQPGAASQQPLPGQQLRGKPSGFRSLVGYNPVVWREGYAEIELLLGDEHMNSVGIVHGGVYMTILDAAMGHATTWCPVPENRRYCVTISLTTSFIAPAKAGVIRAIAHLEVIENRVGHCRGEIVDENGRILVAGQGSFRYATGSEATEGVPRR